MIGGTTPGIKLFEAVREETHIPIQVLIRPRFGDFCYTDYEWRIMKEEIRMFRDRGADGIVIGMLKPDGILDRDRMEALLEERGGMSVTLHRAFDVCKEPMETLAVAKTMGIQTILTSGQKNTCMEGTKLLARCSRKARRKSVFRPAGASRRKESNHFTARRESAPTICRRKRSSKAP
ncbi:MAG: copper homeostasis protein CutC [Sellimonas intestinalis]